MCQQSLIFLIDRHVLWIGLYRKEKKGKSESKNGRVEIGDEARVDEVIGVFVTYFTVKSQLHVR